MDAYSANVMDHFEHPRNVGLIDAPDGEAVRSNPAMRIHMMLRIADGTITEARWQTKGCPASIASSSRASELVRGWSIEDVDSLERDSIAKALGGLPAAKMHCSALAAEALKAAVADYRGRQTRREAPGATV